MAMFPFVGSAYDGRSPSFDASRLVNYYLEASETGTSRTQAMLIGTPGLLLWKAFASTGGVKAMITFNTNLAVVVIGSDVWTVTSSAVATMIGTVAGNGGPAYSMASNGSVIMLVTGTHGYFINPIAGTVDLITDPDFVGGDAVDFIDGYFIWNKPNTGQFQITQLYGTDIDTLDFATAEGSPDNIVTLIVDHREAWMLGQNTTEVFVNSGNPDFPFERIQGAFLEVGCAAAHSVAKADNSIFWLANDDRGYGTVQRAAGYNPQRVSNHAVENAINGYSRIDDAVAYTYTQEGHTFYVLSFPTANATWCLDASNGQWHERAYRDPNTALLVRHRSNCQINFAGETLVGDWENGNVYIMRLDVYSDNGQPIESIRQCPHIAGDGKLSFHHSLQIFFQPGVGLSSGQGENPQAMLQWSDDGGFTWTHERWTSIGKMGEFRARARWRRLGRTRDRIYRVSISDPVKRIIIGANLELTAGMS